MDILIWWFILFTTILGSSGLTRASTFLTLSKKQAPQAGLPDCAAQCFTSWSSTTRCSSNDEACLCADQASLTDAETCIHSNCIVVQALEAKRILSQDICPQPARDRSGLIRRLAWTGFGISTFAVIARLTSRLPALGGSDYGWDDWTILLALALLTPIDVIISLMSRNGIGRDLWMVTPSEITNVLHLLYVDEFLYTFLLDATKISILLLYLRMFPDADSLGFRCACLLLIGILVTHAVAMNLTLVIGCMPISFTWKFWDQESGGHCFNQQAQIYATAALNIAFDLLVYLFPIPKLVKLPFSSMRIKVAVCMTFMAGFLVTVCSIVRLRYLVAFGISNNVTWDYGPIVLWSDIECHMSVTCACVPSLAGLAQRVWTHGFTFSNYGRDSFAMRRGRYELRLRSSSRLDQTGTTMEDAKTPSTADKMEVSRYQTLSDTAFSERGNVEAEAALGRWETTKPLPIPGRVKYAC